ncbi:MAG TPA: serine/threonine-protein kinase, partial [Planctomycetota bacterium]|nr:serine/threonine-protein kinase [Planctomycetota bacterium]
MSWEDGSLESLRGFLTGPPEGGEEDHAFARRAVEQGYLTRDQVEECLSLQPGRPLLDTLREKRLLSESRIQIILTLLKPHPGNPRAPGEGVPSGPSSDTRLSIPDPDSGPGAGRRLGRYELLDVVGEGGMGIVFRAKDPELGRDVALKVLKPPLSFSSQQMERFRREQRTAAKLTHPGIVAIYDLGRENDVLYYTMELVRGTALSASLGLPAAVGVLAKVARAVQFAHDHGVIHRDLKPANIMVDSRGEPRVLDFGLSRDVDVPSELTRTGSPFGTLDYMSPEQAEGRVDAVGVATDIYALGAILYQLLAGRPPFTGSSAREIVSRILSKDPEPPPGPAELSSIALQALEKEPTRRYLSAGAFAEDLDRYLAGKAVEARPPSLRARLWRKAGFQRATLVPALAVVALGLAGLGWWASGAASGAGRVACVVELLGSVRAITQGATGPVSLHQWLLSNQGLSTGASPSRAVLRYLDGTILRVSPEAILQSLSENQASGSGKRGTRKAGFLV